MSTVDYIEYLEAQLAFVKQRIADFPHWGAALTALDEERRGIERALQEARERMAPPSAKGAP